MSDDKEAKAQEEHVPEGEVIYRAIRSDGDHELGMTNAELMWSGLAAGLSMAFSLAGRSAPRALAGNAVAAAGVPPTCSRPRSPH